MRRSNKKIIKGKTMERIDYFKILSFLAFVGSTFLSTVFHYPAFTISWLVVMMLFIAKLNEESSEWIILAFTALAYVPLELIATLNNVVSHTAVPNGISDFAWLLVAFVVIEFILAISWLNHNHNKDQ